MKIAHLSYTYGLNGLVLPADAHTGRIEIERVCAEHDREIEDDHYGVLIPYSLTGALPEVLMASLAKRRPDLDPIQQFPVRRIDH